MCERRRTHRARRLLRADGFTLIELLVVVVIIGILIAIAIPMYLRYQEGSHDKSASSDLRSGIMALELCYTNNDNSFPASISFTGGTGSPSATACAADKVNYSQGTTLTYAPSPSGCTDATCTSYVLTATNAMGTGKTYTYDSAAGGIVS